MEAETTNNQKTQIERRDNTHKTILSILIIVAILATLGTGFGIYGTIQANRAINVLEENGLMDSNSSDIDDEDTEELYGLPSEASSIQTVSIVYNNGDDYIDVYDDNTAEYYSSLNDISNETEVDSNKIFQYIFDNDLKYFGDNDVQENETWAIELMTTDGDSYVSGTGDAPEWFSALLTQLEVDTKGYQSRQ